jgi:hypothetical protein
VQYSYPAKFTSTNLSRHRENMNVQRLHRSIHSILNHRRRGRLGLLKTKRVGRCDELFLSLSPNEKCNGTLCTIPSSDCLLSTKPVHNKTANDLRRRTPILNIRPCNLSVMYQISLLWGEKASQSSLEILLRFSTLVIPLQLRSTYLLVFLKIRAKGGRCRPNALINVFI